VTPGGRVAGRVVVVTGAAQGIGAGFARALATEGANVVVADINEAQATATAAAIRDDDGIAIAVGVDVADRAQVRALIERTVHELGRLDVLFNNAGISRPEAFLDITEESWRRIMEVNGLGVLIGMQESARQFIAQRSGGKIVNTASIAARQGFPDFAHYCASKAAVVSLTQAGARSFAEHGITVNAFAPGVVDTPLWEDLDRVLAERDHKPEGQPMAEFSEGILVGRPATPEDIAPVAVFLASADSDYITGQVVMVDGGMVLV
jgi:meso-butanediol dehydrogenase / (S,S)-butanediol dehydrogenase / diacetyl reductase